MSTPGSISTNKNFSRTIMNNILFDNRKNHRANKISSTSNFSFDPNLLRELNARYLHDMNAKRTINENGFSTYHQSSPTKKSNKWCTAHVRISWMIYHQQQQRLKNKLSLSDNKKDEEQQQQQHSSLNNKLSDLISNTKKNFPFSSNDSSLSSYPTSSFLPSFNHRSSFGGLGSLFPSVPTPVDRKADMNESIPSLNLDWSRFHRDIGSSLSRKVSLPNIKSNISDNSKPSSHSLPSTFPIFDPLTFSIIERQRLLATYASFFTSTSQAKNFFPTNIDSRIFFNNNSSSLFPNPNSAARISASIQREHFLNSLRLSQQSHEQIIERERGTIGNNDVLLINKTLKTKIEQVSPTNNEKTKRIKLINATSSAFDSSISSSVKPKHVKREKQSLSPSPIVSTIPSDDLISKEESISSVPATI